MSEELRPCPFCGGKAETNMILFDSKEIISCSNRKCYAHYTGFTTTRKAWNNRPIEDSLRQEVERLRALMEWKPIESAPRDGTSIFVLTTNLTPYVVRYNKNASFGCNNYGEGWQISYCDDDWYNEALSTKDLYKWKPISAPHIEGK